MYLVLHTDGKVPSYYTKQLNNVKPKEVDTPINFQFKSDKGHSKWLSLNEESRKDLIEWLQSLEIKTEEN